MFQASNRRPEFDPSMLGPASPAGEAALVGSWAAADDTDDLLEQLQAADAADRALLRLVMCAALATLLLALATRLGL